MMLSNPGRLGLGDRIETSCKALARTLTTMDKSVDKAELDPARFNVDSDELIERYVALHCCMQCFQHCTKHRSIAFATSATWVNYAVELLLWRTRTANCNFAPEARPPILGQVQSGGFRCELSPAGAMPRDPSEPLKTVATARPAPAS
jgi:hypothetical protein